MAKTAIDDLLVLQCEKIVNESWSKAANFYDDIKRIVEKGGPNTESEVGIMMIAANAALQKMTLDRATDQLLFGLSEEMSSCGQNPQDECPCDREVCLMK